MDNNELNKLLHQLHDEIAKTQAVDEKGSELLRDLEVDISALLERLGENPEEVHPSIVQRLDSTLKHFEVTHPSLTTVISQVMDSLSYSGI